MPKFDFSVTTRDGHQVDNIQIFGKDLPDAERKLRQMYCNCKITKTSEINTARELSQSADIEELLTLIGKQD